MEKPPHVARMEEELSSLAEKTGKLSAFTATEIFRSLPRVDQQLLLAQFGAMKTYETILQFRLERALEG